MTFYRYFGIVSISLLLLGCLIGIGFANYYSVQYIIEPFASITNWITDEYVAAIIFINFAYSLLQELLVGIFIFLYYIDKKQHYAFTDKMIFYPMQIFFIFYFFVFFPCYMAAIIPMFDIMLSGGSFALCIFGLFLGLVVYLIMMYLIGLLIKSFVCPQLNVVMNTGFPI